MLKNPKFLMAYPFVFEFDEEIYMLPTSRKHPLTLYHATNFPTEWEPFKVLHQKHYSDPTLIQFNGTWWLFVNLEESDSVHQHLLYSDGSPFGPWVDHPHNCVIFHHTKFGPDHYDCMGGYQVLQPHATGHISKRQVGVRSGGRAFIYQQRLYRFIQRSDAIFGDGLDLYEVTRLSKDEPMEMQLVKGFRSSFRHRRTIGMLCWVGCS